MALLVIIALAGAYLLGYVYVRHTFTSGVFRLQNPMYSVEPAPLTYFSRADHRSGSRKIWYYLFYPIVMADCAWNGRGYVDPDGWTVRPQQGHDWTPQEVHDWIPVGDE